jgi:homoserine acetyltransferase
VQWFREHGYRHGGAYPDLGAFLREQWEQGFLEAWDANDLLRLLETWQTGDVSQVRHGGDLAACLAGITARGLVMPCKTDLYFPPEDSYIEARGQARVVVIDSVWGHMAGGGSNAADTAFIQEEVNRFMNEDKNKL